MPGLAVFNSNHWSGEARSVILTCWSEYSVLHHCTDQLHDMCTNAQALCERQIATIDQQWRANRFPVERMYYFAQQPDLHIRIEAFLSGIKTLLDLLVQLLSAQNIVTTKIEGFHRDREIYGGRVLNVLIGNAVTEKKETAKRIHSLIVEHKDLWIDQAIFARDFLVHPDKAMHQLMFRLEFQEKEEGLSCHKIHPPEISLKPIHAYAQETLKQTREFSSEFLALVSNSERQA
jgi:hypothetical protein